jgi:hypothetical protein
MVNSAVFRDSSVITEPDFAYILDIEKHVLAFTRPQLTPISIGIFHSIEATAGFETRRAYLFTRL